MNLKDYKQKRIKEISLLAIEKSKHRIKCYKCFRPQSICFCHEITPLETNCEFRILMHPMEAKKIKIATGRLANICLNKCQIIEGVDFSNNIIVNKLIENPLYLPLVLYPGTTSLNLSESNISESQIFNKTPLIFIIDGTWPNAKIMMRESKNIQKLARVSFTTKELSKFSIKHQPSKFCLSTIESIYYLLGELDRCQIENLYGKQIVLLDTLKKIVDFQIECANDPNRPSYRRKKGYKNQSERVDNKKWLKRSICYDEKNYK